MYADFADSSLHPMLQTKKGGLIPVHKVRLSTGEKARAIGGGPTLRHVTSTKGSNHHAVIERLPSGKWADKIVSLSDIKRGTPVPKRPHAGASFTLAAGDFVLLTVNGEQRLLRVTKISAGQIAMISHSDGRSSDEIKAAKEVVYRTGSSLVRDGASKVLVTYLGEIRRCGG